MTRYMLDASTDTDQDGEKDIFDLDDDNDGILDVDEGAPVVPTSSGLSGPLGINDGTVDNTGIAVSFGMSSNDVDDPNEAHILDSITVDGTVYTDFILPDDYKNSAPDGTQPMPVNSNVRLTVNGTSGLIDNTDPDYEDEILTEAFQSRNLNAYQTLDSNDFSDAAFTLTYNNPVMITAGGFIAISERGGNNSTTVTALDAMGNVLGSVTADRNVDYLPNTAQQNASQDAVIALFPLDDLGAVGKQIAQLVITFPDPSTDAPDGKIFIFGNQSLLQGVDTDNDGIPDSADPDSDNDGIADLYESGANVALLDPDGNGIIDGAQFQDTDGDGLADKIETINGANQGTDPIDSDTDDVADFRDLDADNDGITDFIENQPTATYAPYDDKDTDGDGIIDLADTVNGLGGSFATPTNTDTKDKPDYLDDDSDNDGTSDTDESGLGAPGADNNDDGIGDAISNVSYTDQDGDVTGLPNGGLTNTDADPSEPDFRSLGNTAPVATDDTAITVPRTAKVIDLIGGDNGNGVDSDPENDALSLVSIEDPANPGVQIPFAAGTTVTLDSGTTVTFGATASDPVSVTQPASSDGTETFNYTITDGTSTDAATVTLQTDTDADGIANVIDIDDDNDGITDITEAGFNPTEEFVLPSGTLGQADSFGPSPLSFQVINNTALGEGQLHALNPFTAEYEPIGDNAGFSYNAMGFDPDSGFLYALVKDGDTTGATDALGNPVMQGDLIKIDADGETFLVGSSGINSFTGDVMDGYLVTQSSGKFHKIDLNTGTATELTTPGGLITTADYALIDGALYGVASGNRLVTVEVDLVNDTVTQSVVDLTGEGDVALNLTGSGAMWGATNADGDRELYAFNNKTGEIFEIKDFGSADPVASYVGMTVVSNNNDGGRLASMPFTPPLPDTDGDGIPDHLDIDKDNDGITDNVEAQTTAGYIAPSGIDADNDGLDDAYDADTTSPDATTDAASAGLTEVDTDEDGIVDTKDLDTDADGKADVAERGDGQPTSVPAVLTDTDGDGLLDVFEGGNVDDGFDVNDENIAGDNGGADGDYTNFNLADSDVDTNADDAVPGRTDNDARPMINDLDWRDDEMLTEDVWFHGVPCDPAELTGVDTQWTVYNGSDKLKVEVKIPLKSLFGENSQYTFTDVDISAYEDVFAALGVTDLHKVKAEIKDEKIFIRIIGKDISLSQAQIDALPDVIDTPVQVRDAYGNERWVKLCVGIEDTKINSPIAFDLNDDGEIGVTGPSTAKDRVDDTPGDGVLFDIDADGTLDRIEWLSGDGDALLVDNRDGRATRDMDGARLFGDQGGLYATGYDKLAELDANNDGVLNGDELEGLALWADNGDATVEAGELHSVQAHGITSITVGYSNVTNDAGEILMQSAFDTGPGGLLTPPTEGVDLVVAHLSLRDASLEDGQTLRVDLDVANLGSQNAAPVTTTVYWSATDTFDAATAVALKIDGHGLLAAGEFDANERVKIDYDDVAPLGDGYIFAVIDDGNAHSELDEGNNVSNGVAFTVDGGSARSDLSIRDISARDTTLEDGQKLVINLDVENTGDLKARGVSSTLYWNATDTFDIATAVELATDGHGALGIGEIDTNERIRVSHDDIAALGDGFVFAMIDADNAHLESDETNNLSDGLAISLASSAASDVAILDIDANRSTLRDGEKVKFFVDVANQGDVDAQDAVSTFYWSATDTFDSATAVELDDIAHRTLEVGEVEQNETLRLKYEDLEDLGSGWIFAQISADAVDAETGNNLSDGLYIDVV